MAQAIPFNGQLVTLPGVYTQNKSGITNPPQAVSYGNVLVIHNNSTSTFGGGAGIAGTIQSGQDSIYGFDNLADFRAFVGGGVTWDIALPLFKPLGSQAGISKLYYVRALTTVAATLTLTFTNGSLVFKCRHEGLVGNGSEVSSVLTQGFAATLSAGTIDTAKFVLKFWRGTYTGIDASSRPYDGVSEANTLPRLLCQSPEVSTVQQLIDWCKANPDFNNNFRIESSSTATGAIVSGDLSTNSGNKLFAAGSQTKPGTSMDSVLDAVKNLDYTHVISLDGNATATSADNIKIQTHIESVARFGKFLVVGGGDLSTDLTSVSIAAAATYNSNKVLVVHAGCYEFDQTQGTGTRDKNSVYHAAYVLGRIAGITPQTPGTFKAMGYAGELHKMSDKEREKALNAGVITTYYNSDLKAFIITEAVNTLQNNTYLVNQDGKSYLHSVERIKAQVNKLIETQATVELLGNQQAGPNRATLSPEIVKSWVKTKLADESLSSKNSDPLLLKAQNITVSTNGAALCINYEMEPNFEVNILLFTGVIIDTASNS